MSKGANETVKVLGIEVGEEEMYEIEPAFDPITIESQAQYDALITHEARRIAKKMELRCKERKQKVRKGRFFKACKWLFVIVLLVILGRYVYKNYPVPRYDNKTQTIYRNLDNAKYSIPELPKDLPEMAWSEDLPDFIKNDFKKVLDEDWNLVYSFAGKEIHIRRKIVFADEYFLYVTVDNEEVAERVTCYGFYNSSIYFDDGMLKWYYWDDEDVFRVLKVCETSAKKQTLSYHAQDVPVDVKDELSWKIDNYVLVQQQNELSLWQRGHKVTSITSEVGDIAYIYGDYAILATKDNKLYGVNIYISKDSDYVASISLSYIDKVDENSIQDLRCLDKKLVFEFPQNVKYEFPIVRKGDEKYAILPEDIRSYVSYSMVNRGTVLFANNSVNVQRHLVKLSDLNFISADIYYGYTDYMLDPFCWVADVEFEYNGTSYYYKEVPILGYDRSYSLTEAEEAKFTTTVYSVDEFWQIVEAIRETYQSYYIRQGG